jgi:GTP-binding protein HflX
MITQRKSRDMMVRVTLVGYTNVGKSTLMNLIAKSEVFAENKLFATLDSTVRKVVFENIPFLLTDTVGFIRKLPHTLVECFKSTLDEIREADLLIHVIDLSHPEFEDQMKTVNDTLAEIGASDKPVILMFNKIDNYSLIEEMPDGTVQSVPSTPEKLKETYLNKFKNQAVFISAYERINLEEMRKVLLDKVKDRYFEIYPNYLQSNSYFNPAFDTLE